MMLGRSKLPGPDRRDKDIRTGKAAGYIIGAGSNDAGIRIRCLNRLFAS
jgi:hypothetical protein